MNEEKYSYSPMFEVLPFDFPQSEEYISDIEFITMSISGIMDAQIANIALKESCQMLINAINLFEMGFFDCAFYSLRQTIEISIGGIFLYSDKKRILDWNKGKEGFEKGRMTKTLSKEDATFYDVREKLSFYFDGIREIEQRINKYVHKQGVKSFYTYSNWEPDYLEKRKTTITKDFEKYLNACIGAVAVYRLIIDPLPLLLTDENIAMRTPDLITEPYCQTLINKYINEKVIEAYKQTDIYREYYEELSALERQNEAVYNLIHYQFIDTNCADDYEKQAHLLSIHDKLALVIAFASQKVSNCFLMDGMLWYHTNNKSLRRSTSTTFGNCYFKKFFSDNRNFNLPYENIFISRCIAFGETHYIEHNEPLAEQEITLIEQYSAQLNKKNNEANEQLQNWYNEQSAKIAAEQQ